MPANGPERQNRAPFRCLSAGASALIWVFSARPNTRARDLSSRPAKASIDRSTRVFVIPAGIVVRLEPSRYDTITGVVAEALSANPCSTSAVRLNSCRSSCLPRYGPTSTGYT